jgi:hypothetical protein
VLHDVDILFSEHREQRHDRACATLRLGAARG